MADTMMALGDFRFSIDTAAYQQLERFTSQRWASLPRIGRAPAMQHIGQGEDSITLSGVIYPAHRGGLGQINAMRAAAAAGEPLELVTGAGQTFPERMVITAVEEVQTHHLSIGAPRKQEFRLTLSAYGEDQQ